MGAKLSEYHTGCLATALEFRLSRWGLERFRTFDITRAARPVGRQFGTRP